MHRILCITAIAVLIAVAAPKHLQAAAALQQTHISRTCKDMYPNVIVPRPDGGTLETPNGYFYGASVQQGSGYALAYCYYGLDRANPSARPVFTVHYTLTGANSPQCTVAGATVTCNLLTTTPTPGTIKP